MTEQQLNKFLMSNRKKCGVVQNILDSGIGREERSQARLIYNRIICDPHTPKEKKQLWRDLGKLLSINDIEFGCDEQNKVFISSVSSIKVKQDEARRLSVDCLRSFCAKLGMRRTGHLKKDELLKRMHEISLLVAAKRTPYNAEIHRLFQLRLWTEDEEESTQSKRDEQSSADGSTTGENKDETDAGYTIEPLVIAGGGGLHMEKDHSKNMEQKYHGEEEEDEDNVDDSESDDENEDDDDVVWKRSAARDDQLSFLSGSDDSLTVVEVSNKRQNIEEDDNTQENDNETGDCFDIGIEEEKERALLFLMKAYEHHVSLSCDYQGHITTHDTLMELHKQRANRINEQLITFISQEFLNVGVEKKKEETLSFYFDAFKTHASRQHENEGYVLAYRRLKDIHDERSAQIRKRILEIIHGHNN